MDSAAATATLAAVAATGMFEGAALYISACTVPHFKDTSVPAKEVLAEYRRFYPSAMSLQKTLAVLGVAASGLATYTHKDDRDVMLPFAVAGAAQAAVIAYTLARIMPINERLLPVGDVEKEGEKSVRAQLVQWGECHGVRTLLGAVAFGASLYGVHLLLRK